MDNKIKKIWWIYLFPLIDIITTTIFVTKWGIQYEGNPLFRFVFNHIGLFVFPLMFIVALIVLTCLLKFGLYFNKVGRSDYPFFIVFMVILVIYSITLSSNVYWTLKFLLLGY